MKIKNLFLNLVVVLFSTLTYSQDFSVRPLSDFYQNYNDKHRIIITAIEARDDLSITQKLLLYESEMSKLKTEFKTNRRSEYESKSIELSVAHSCTKGSSGGVKDCGEKCISAPNENSYTRTDWIRVVGTNKGTNVSADGSSACLRMTRAGKGRNSGTLFAIFKYKQESIAKLIDSETIELFNQITKQ